MEPTATTFIPASLLPVLQDDAGVMGALVEARTWMETKAFVRYEHRQCPELAMALVKLASREFRPEMRSLVRALARAVEHVEAGKL